jgi:hypothetical protein
MSTQKRILDFKGMQSILNSRVTIQASHVGGVKKTFTVQGKGQFFAAGSTYTTNGVERTNAWDRTIYNLKANSKHSMNRKENKLLLRQGMIAEAQGDMETATEFYNSYLNSIQVSFSLRGDSSLVLQPGSEVAARVEEVDTEAGDKQYVVNEVTPVAPEAIAKTKYEVSALIGDDADLSEEDKALIAKLVAPTADATA